MKNTKQGFQQFRFHLPDSDKYIDYNLFIPEGAKSGEKYPLVIFLHDLGSCSDDPLAPLTQGKGAVVWASEENQRKRPCFVAAPCYTRKCADDDFSVTWEANATAELIRELCHTYAIDPARVYGTGQSMGCMMLCELSLRFPDLFAGCFLVAGQWDPGRMGKAAGQNFFVLVSERDIKAFPIMGACMEAMEKQGADVLRGGLDARAPLSEQNQKIRALCAEAREKSPRTHLFFTWYEGDSVLKDGETAFPGTFHVNTWAHAYDLEAIQEWLFSCVRSADAE